MNKDREIDSIDREIDNLISVLSGEDGDREDAMKTAQKIQTGLESIDADQDASSKTDR